VGNGLATLHVHTSDHIARTCYKHEIRQALPCGWIGR
jgi:hypothetical protein